MKFPILALYERSLRVETRSIAMCFARMALPGMVLVALIPIAIAARLGQLGAPGLQFFQTTMWMNVFFVTLAGLSYFASAIAEEKEEMTLGLLRMTGLSPLAILLGKSTSRLTGVLLLLLVQLPFTLLAVTLGGVSNTQVIAAYAVLLAYTFFLCNLALVWSVVFRHAATAAALTALSLLLFMALPPLLAALLQSGAWSTEGPAVRAFVEGARRFFTSWTEVSPFKCLYRIFATGSTVSPLNAAVLSHIGFGVGSFLLAWTIFDLCTREQKDQSPSRGMAFRRGGPGVRVPASVAGGRALAWREFRFTVGGWTGVALRLLLFGALFAGVITLPLWWGGDVDRDDAGSWLMIMSLILAALSLAFDASRLFREEVRWKTLSSLVVLPVSVREMAYRKIGGALHGLWPMVILFALGVALNPRDFGRFIKDAFSEAEAVLVIPLILLQFAFFLHLVTYLSLLVKRGALALAIVIYYCGGIAVSMPMAMFAAFGGGRSAWPFLIVSTAATGGVTFLLHKLIGARLLRLAAEE